MKMTKKIYPTKSEFQKLNKTVSNSFLFLGLIITINANAEILQIVENDTTQAIELTKPNYPNPFMPTSETVISTKDYNINIKDSIVVKIYNDSLEFITEKTIKKANEKLNSVIKLNFRELLNNKSGIYYYHIKIGQLKSDKKKIIL